MDGLLTSPIKLNTTMKNRSPRKTKLCVAAINHSTMDKNVSHAKEITLMLTPKPVVLAQKDLNIGQTRRNVFLLKRILLQILKLKI